MLIGILPDSEVQQELFSNNLYTKSEQNLMQKVDEINTKYGSDKTNFASTGIEKYWQMKQEHLSPIIYYRMGSNCRNQDLLNISF